jgi:hypothetical protein
MFSHDLRLQFRGEKILAEQWLPPKVLVGELNNKLENARQLGTGE